MRSKYQLPEGLVTIRKCRICGKEKLQQVLSLGTQYLSNFVEVPDQAVFAAPVELVLCSKRSGGCGLLQLKHSVPGDLLYRKFWYKSGTNQTMKDALADVVDKAETIARLRDGDIVLDIGANDGTLLRCYDNKNLQLVGFEPAVNLVRDAQVGTTRIINDFFNYDAFKDACGSKKAMVVTSIAMFYDLEDPNAFTSQLAKVLDENGIWIIQMNYLATMLANNAFDNIVHEHLEYYSLLSLQHLLEMHGLVVFDVELNDINGGSMRAYVKHKGCKKYTVKRSVGSMRAREKKGGLEDPRTYRRFANRLGRLKDKTYNFIKAEVKKGKSIYAYGASTRGNTLLQYYNLDHRLVNAAADRNPSKWGKKTVGTLIPIISEEQARNEKPDYFFVLPWYFADEFIDREKEFLKSGGRLILPLPELRVFPAKG